MDTITGLEAHLTVIRSGVTPAPEGFRLSPERAERLDADLRALREHRARASVAARTYVVGGGHAA